MTASPEQSRPVGDHTFIGREKELAAIDNALDLACGGQGRVVMLAGPPGIGKTCTSQRIADHAAARGMLVL